MRLLTLLAALLPLLGSAATGPAEDSPLKASRWSSLTFQQQALWVTATSELQQDACDEKSPGADWCITAVNSVAENRETLRLRVNSRGSLLQRERESVGRKDRRVKRWSYQPEAVTRLRLEPGRTEGSDDYIVTSERQLNYPADGSEVTDPLLLLWLAAQASSGRLPADPVLVQTDVNFYRVSLTDAGVTTLPIDASIDGERVQESREVRRVRIEARAVEPLADKPDFSLLGLSGSITVAVDTADGLPVQLTGQAPRLGSAEINLIAATRRPSAP